MGDRVWCHGTKTRCQLHLHAIRQQFRLRQQRLGVHHVLLLSHVRPVRDGWHDAPGRGDEGRVKGGSPCYGLVYDILQRDELARCVVVALDSRELGGLYDR